MKVTRMFALTMCALAASMLSSVTMAGQHHKGENYKGEAMPCPQLTLLDGLYVGAAAGYDSYRVKDEVIGDGFFVSDDGDFSTRLDPRVNVTGAVGGGFIGLGHYFNNFYLAVELFGNASAAVADYELSSIVEGVGHHYKTRIEVKSSYGVGLLEGYKLNNAVLLYVRLGYNWTDMVVNEDFIDGGVEVIDVSESNSSHGFNYGVGTEVAFYPNWSVRAEYSHTDYTAFDTTIATDITPSSNQFMMGLIYHFS